MLAAVSWAWIAIVVAIVWKMIYGGVFYARPVLGNFWMRQVNLDPANIKREDAMMGIVWALVWSIVGAALFNVIWSWTSGKGVSDGLTVGAVAGLALAATAAMVHPVFEGRPKVVMWLYCIYHVIE